MPVATIPPPTDVREPGTAAPRRVERHACSRVHVSAPARLHFGLFAPSTTSGRRFGGAGLMVREPRLELTAWSPSGGAGCEDGRPSSAADDASSRPRGGVLADPADARRAEARAAEFLQRFRVSSPAGLPDDVRIRVERTGPSHAGFGTGTQLGMAVAAAAARLAGRAADRCMPADLAAAVGRGQRSGIGVHGFSQGGLLVDGGKAAGTRVAPPIARTALPAEWRIVLVLPDDPASTAMTGAAERRAFEMLPATAEMLTARMCRLVVMGLLPAAAEGDFAGFGEALFELQSLAGEAFAPAQGGRRYAGPVAEQVVELLRRSGVTGVGQSSWGPALYAMAADEDHAGHVADLLRRRLGSAAGRMLITEADNDGAVVRG